MSMNNNLTSSVAESLQGSAVYKETPVTIDGRPLQVTPNISPILGKDKTGSKAIDSRTTNIEQTMNSESNMFESNMFVTARVMSPDDRLQLRGKALGNIENMLSQYQDALTGRPLAAALLMGTMAVESFPHGYCDMAESIGETFDGAENLLHLSKNNTQSAKITLEEIIESEAKCEQGLALMQDFIEKAQEAGIEAAW